MHSRSPEDALGNEDHAMRNDARNVTVWTIGHSTHSYDTFLDLLKRHRIEAVADVRSRPFSGYNPHFNQERIRTELEVNGITYVHLGTELGAHREDGSFPAHEDDTFSTISRSPLFRGGLKRLVDGARKYRLAMMCGEKDPLTCHRTHLIERALRDLDPDVRVDHIEASGMIETAHRFESRLMKDNDVDEDNLFMTRDELVNEAYRRARR